MAVKFNEIAQKHACKIGLQHDAGHPSDAKHGDDTSNLDDDDDDSFKNMYLGCARCASGEGRRIFNGRGESGE